MLIAAFKFNLLNSCKFSKKMFTLKKKNNYYNLKKDIFLNMINIDFKYSSV